MLKSRHTTQIRMAAASDVRTDGALTLNDVPMLLKVIRETIGVSLEAHERQTPGNRPERDGSSRYLRGSSWGSDKEVEEEQEDKEPNLKA